MDIRFIEQLVGMLEASTLSAIEVEEDQVRIRLERSGSVRTPLGASTPVEPTAAPISAPPSVVETIEKAVEWKDLKEITSPIVGTFRVFGTVGQNSEVKKGQTVCQIEAMKLFNAIEMPEDGIIVHMLIKDGDMVEFGQTMFRYKQL